MSLWFDASLQVRLAVLKRTRDESLLNSFVNDDDEDVREALARRSGDRNTLERLVADWHDQVRAAAREALALRSIPPVKDEEFP